MRAALAVAAFLVLAGCAGSVPRSSAVPASTPAQASSAPASAAPGTAFCAKLRASGTPQVVYASEVEHQVGLASGGGTVTPEAIAAGRAIVALWIAISCPKYAHLEQHG